MTNNLKEIEIAETQTKSSDPLVQIMWLIDGLDVYQRTDGKRGHSLGDCKRYVLSNVKTLINQKEKEAEIKGLADYRLWLLVELDDAQDESTYNYDVLRANRLKITISDVEDRIKQLKEELKEDK